MRTDGYFHKVKTKEPVKTDLFDMERMIRLRDFMRDELRDEQVNMAEFMSECGTVCCIAGWAAILFRGENHRAALGLYNDAVSQELFSPLDWYLGHNYPKSRVIRCLDRMIETGEGPRWDLA